MRRFRKPGRSLIIGFGILLLLTQSCKDHDLYQGSQTPTKESYFDFATTQDCYIDINYGIKNYPVIFELYVENPLKEHENGHLVKTDQEPIYRATTCTNGRFSGTIALPSYVNEVYLYSDYPGTVPSGRINVVNNKILFNQDTFTSRKSKSRATTDADFLYPDNYLILGEWEETGFPHYMKQERKIPSAQYMYDVKKILYDSNVKYKTEFFGASINMDIHITKATKVNLVFLNSRAVYKNTIGYYTYPTGKAPASVNDIKNPVITFPHISMNYNSAGLAVCPIFCGDQVELKYWNEITQAFEDEFPAGISIGWFIIPDSFGWPNKGQIRPSPYYEHNIHYSTNTLNKDNKQRTISLHDRESKQLVLLSFEDHLSKTWDDDEWDYTDATFYIHIEEPNAINTDNMPELPDSGDGVNEANNYVEYTGSLAFEDLWPQKGDYDMNDMVIYYKSRVYKNILTNKVIRIIDEFIPVHDGAGHDYINGFGYQYHNITSDKLSNTSIRSSSGLISAYMKGQNLEPEQERPTFILFDNMREAVAQKTIFTITNEINAIDESLIRPPYNPFIIIKSNEGRGREMHLINYPPTSLIDNNLFGKEEDKSQVEDGLYYVSNNNFPFAIHIANSYYNWPVEKTRIDKTYPDFELWALSLGTSNKDWYKKPAQ